MTFIRIFGLFIMIILASPIVEADSSFDQFAQGALSVYSTFKEPSKKESEQFYTFIKSKWRINGCSQSCTMSGKAAGNEYAHRMNIELEPNHS